jgi:hypothetical protein
MTTKDVLALALEALKLAEESLGSFVSDHGWSQRDMDNLDTVTAAIKQAQQAITPETGNAATPLASAITAGNGQAPYSLDADPQGIRARVVSAVVGAMAYGASNTNKPPEGHWLNEVWDIARNEAAQQAQEPVEADAKRYRKLQQWMSSNVKEGWNVVEQLGAVAAWEGHDAMDSYLDALDECNVGLSQPAPKQAEPCQHCGATHAKEDAARAKEQTP